MESIYMKSVPNHIGKLLVTSSDLASNFFFHVSCYGMEMNVEKTKVMSISRYPSPVTIMIDQKQLENVGCYKYLGSMLTNDGRCTREIKSRIAMAKAAFSKKKILFTSKLDLNLRKKLIRCYI